MSVAVVAAGATIVNGVLSYKASRDATKAQTDASDKALEVFEKNAGISTKKLEESAGTAIDTLKTGQAKSENILQEGAKTTIDTLGKGFDQTKSDILAAYGIQEKNINSSAVAQSKYINAARESAANFIVQGFGEGIATIESGRDLVNKVLQSTTNDAQEQLKIARGSAIAAQERGLSNIRSDFEPFLKAGQVSAQELEKLVNDPNAQKEFITNNPFFQSLADDAEERTLSNPAARGRTGSGSTKAALQTELLKLGDQLLNTSINQRLATASLGLNAANSVMSAETSVADAISQIEQETGRSLSDLTVNLGVNQGNNIRDAAKNVAALQVEQGQALAANEKTAGNSLADIESVRSGNLVTVGRDSTNQLIGLDKDTTKNIASVQEGLGTNLTNLNTASNNQIANMQNNLGVNQANVLTGAAANTADTLIGRGDAEAAGIVSTNNAITGGIKDLTTIAADEYEKRKTANG